MNYRVRLTTDQEELYAFLRRDPIYAAYAIGDLEPEYFARCTWYAAEGRAGQAALALLYQGLEPPVLLTMGDVEGVEAIFREAPPPQQIYMHAQVAHLPVFQAHYGFDQDRVRPMLRMAVAAERFQPARSPRGEDYPFPALRSLGPGDLEAIRALYAWGGGHVPDAFDVYQLWDGVFYGVELASELPLGLSLVAVAGTHLLAPNWGVAALGNVYTHPGYRGRGLAQAVCSAVTAELLRRQLSVVLNVEKTNGRAIHVYRKLGYRVHLPYYEGIGVRHAHQPC
jgi:ribosomal protein S18 acetylase RimI-like enzyme